MDFKQRLSYLLRSIYNVAQKQQCPFCNGTKFVELDRKYLFTLLLKCNNCKLNHRHPKDDERWLKNFYQEEYKIETHMMTKFPSDEEIEILKNNNFLPLRNYDNYINALCIGKVNIIDYGCSWGYNVFKLLHSGYNAIGYELSVPRAEFGKSKLGVKIFSNTEALPKQMDIMLSSHVIEHLSNIQEFISVSKTHLSTEGVFIAFCPNGNAEYRNREPEIWHVNWGALHPNYIDVEFAKQMFKNNPYLILSDDWEYDAEIIKNWDGKSQHNGSRLDGKELLIIAKPNIEI